MQTGPHVICKARCKTKIWGPLTSMRNFKTAAMATKPSLGLPSPTPWSPPCLSGPQVDGDNNLLKVQGDLVPQMSALLMAKNTFLLPPGRQVCQRTTGVTVVELGGVGWSWSLWGWRNRFFPPRCSSLAQYPPHPTRIISDASSGTRGMAHVQCEKSREILFWTGNRSGAQCTPGTLWRVRPAALCYLKLSPPGGTVFQL